MSSKDQDGPYVTERGFNGYASLTDTKNQRVRVKISSSAEETAAWIFCDHNPYEQKRIDSGQQELWCPAPHLNVYQAAVVRDALTKFISDHSITLELSQKEVELLRSLHEHGHEHWADADEDGYGYMSEQTGPLTEKLVAGENLISHDDLFALVRLYEFGREAWVEAAGPSDDEQAQMKALAARLDA